MVEAIQCPSCQTRYGLKPARVRTGLRRAQCFRCGDVFHIEAEVRRLLEQAGLEALESPASTASVPLAALAEAIQIAPPVTPEAHEPAAPTPALEANDLALADLELPDPAAAWPSPAETAPIRAMALPAPEAAPELPALDLPSIELPPIELPKIDLPAAEAAPSPDAAMAAFELPPVPLPGEAAAPELAPQPEEVTGSYSSAKDAIARLFGDAPPAPSPTAKLRSALDMDAGMKALEDTLGGVRPESLSSKPFTAPAEPAPAPAPAPAPEAVPMQASELPSSTATLRMSVSDMMAAIQSAAPAAPEPPEITQEEVTMVLPPPPAPTAGGSSAADAPADPSALRLKIGDQVYTGLDLPTIAKWIEEGRVLEEHQVARGMSENWMEAAKVPALRPVFERLRRSRGSDLPPPPPSSLGDSAQLKRGLFGGMFGKKD